MARRVLLAVVAGAAWIGLDTQAAIAACHAFEITADPATVAEGAAVRVTVSRDAAVGPSQIDVETIDGTARGGADYDAVARRTIAFTNETSQTFPVQTKDDSDRESAETFRLHLSNPGGCAVNPNFRVGPDVIVTISANDEAAAPATTRGGAATTAARPGTTNATPSTAPAGAAADLGSTTAPPSLPQMPGATAADGPSTTGDDNQIALSEDDDGGLGILAVALALGVAAALGGTGWWTWQRRRATPLEP